MIPIQIFASPFAVFQLRGRFRKGVRVPGGLFEGVVWGRVQGVGQ